MISSIVASLGTFISLMATTHCINVPTFMTPVCHNIVTLLTELSGTNEFDHTLFAHNTKTTTIIDDAACETNECGASDKDAGIDSSAVSDISEHEESNEFQESAKKYEESHCMWWMGGSTDNKLPMFCNTMTLLRTGPNTIVTALKHAAMCAEISGDTCILSHEVGMQVPGIFVWDSTSVSMRGLLAPRSISAPNVENDSVDAAMLDTESVLVSVQRPSADSSKSTSVIDITMNVSVYVEYFDALNLVMQTELLEGDSAFCFQLLLHTLTDACKNELQQSN